MECGHCKEFPLYMIAILKRGNCYRLHFVNGSTNLSLDILYLFKKMFGHFKLYGYTCMFLPPFLQKETTFVTSCLLF